MNKKQIFSFVFAAMIVFSLSSISIAYAHPHHGQIGINEHSHESNTELIPLDSSIGLEKTILFFHAPTDNALPWGFVEGKIANHVAEYPVIIQIYRDGEAAHFAQTNVNDDGTYEYQFRVRDVENGNIIRAFEGDYTVTIFKVVYLHPLNSV
ncbi:MAG: hypothetical protein ACE5RJ_05310 [Nitrosopumilaceae archaeon]